MFKATAPRKLKRHHNIIAFEESLLDASPRYIGFHSGNLELAEISEEAFKEMTWIDVTTGEDVTVPDHEPSEAFNQLAEWNAEQVDSVKSGQINFGIRSLTINVTQICNLKCTYCAAGGDGTYGDPVTRISIEKTLPQLKFLMGTIAPGKKLNISFVGGEPLLYPEGVWAIYDYVTDLAKQKNIVPIFSITTNGTLIDEKIMEKLKTRFIHFTVSLDGTAETNDVLRPARNGGGSTRMTEAGLGFLQTHRSRVASLGLSAVFNEHHQDLEKTYRYFETLKPDWMEFSFAYAQNDPALQQRYVDQMNGIAAIAWANGGELALRKIKTFDHYFSLIDAQQRVQNHCGAGKSYLMMDAKNQLYTCPWVVGDSDEVVGRGDYLDNAKLAPYQKPLIVLNNCQTCWAKYLCGGGCMYIHKLHTGDKHRKDVLFCERTRSLILTALLYYKKARFISETDGDQGRDQDRNLKGNA